MAIVGFVFGKELQHDKESKSLRRYLCEVHCGNIMYFQSRTKYSRRSTLLSTKISITQL
jgi:hypothetical protein